MTPLEFLQLVVPWTEEGFAVINWQTPGKKGFPGKACQTIEEAVAEVERLQSTGVNIFFGLTRQRFASTRGTAADALWVCTNWLDVDFGQPPDKYASAAEALAAVFMFCEAYKLPRPSLIVLSGNGLHVYWFANRNLPIEEWQPLADGLRNAARIWGLKADLGLTGDAARVLRVPDTLNYKYDPPKPVRTLDRYSTLAKHDFAGIFGPLVQLAPLHRAKKTTPKGKVAAAFAHLSVKNNLGAGTEYPPLKLKPILEGCGWLREAYETGGKNFSQGEWNLTTLCATFMENGNELAHQFADKYTGYVHGKTEELWDRKNRERGDKGLGWPSCGAISNAGSKHCASCPLYDLGKSPLNLGLGGDEDAQIEEDEDQKDSKKEIFEIGGARPQGLRLPEGFALDQEGRICAYIASKAEEGKKPKPPQLIHILKTQIKEPSLQYRDGHFGLGFVSSTDLGGWHEVFLPTSNMTLRTGLIKALGDKFVLHNPDDKATPMLDKFPLSWIDKLRKEDVAVRDSGTMGWRHDKDGKRTGFVYGNTFYQADGTTRQLIAAADDEFRSWYQPVGKKSVWLKACKLLTDRKRPELDILIAIGFAAPLAIFGGANMYGATLSVWGRPGTSKSTAQQVAAAVWGHPKQTRESLNSTPKSVQRRLGLTRNLAAYWDDIQDERHQDNLFSTMFVAAGGSEGGRLNPDSTMKQRLDWQTLLVACSNASFVEYLVMKQKSTTAGMRRVFEIEFNRRDDEPGMIDAVDASRTFAALEHNYGVVGAEYAAILAKEHEQIEKDVGKHTKNFKAIVKGRGDESFWWGLCGVLLAGAYMACRLGAELDVPAMAHFLRAAMINNRTIRLEEGTEGGTEDHVIMGLSYFMNDYVGLRNIIYTNRLFDVNNRSPLVSLHEPGPMKKIMIQVARDERVILISKRSLREFLEKSEIHTRQVFDGLKEHLGAKEIKVTLGGGTSWAGAQEHCFQFEVPFDNNHILYDILVARGIPIFQPMAAE